MRQSLTIIFFLGLAGSISAQEQESKLLDRLLRPNETLENSAQTKQFATDKRATSRTAKVKQFYTRDSFHADSFSDQRKFNAQTFSPGRFAAGDRAANLSRRSQVRTTPAIYPTANSRWTRASPSAEKTVVASEFAGNRTFLDRGKSQKSLNRQNPPMTIEQVRDLLNKNK